MAVAKKIEKRSSKYRGALFILFIVSRPVIIGLYKRRKALISN